MLRKKLSPSGDVFEMVKHQSPFSNYFNQICDDAWKQSGKEHMDSYYGPFFFSNFLPVIPTWSDMIQEHVSKMERLQNKSYLLEKTTSISEVTFKNTKILLLNKKKLRTNECIQELYKLCKAREREFCEKIKMKIMKRFREIQEPEESWNKKKQIPKHLQKNISKASKR